MVFGTDPARDRGQQMRTALQRYTRALGRHRDDEISDEPDRTA